MEKFPNIFITKGISLSLKTKERWEKDWKITNIKTGADQSFKQYKKVVETWERGYSDYLISDYNHAYFIDKDDAIQSVINDMGGMNEAGSFMYAAVLEVPTGVSYAENIDIISISFYEYNIKERKYEELKDEKIKNVLKSYFQIHTDII